MPDATVSVGSTGTLSTLSRIVSRCVWMVTRLTHPSVWILTWTSPADFMWFSSLDCLAKVLLHESQGSALFQMHCSHTSASPSLYHSPAMVVWAYNEAISPERARNLCSFISGSVMDFFPRGRMHQIRAYSRLALSLTLGQLLHAFCT